MAAAVASRVTLHDLELTDSIAYDNAQSFSHPPREHVPTVQDFVEKINHNIPSIISKSRSYDNVLAGFITWKDHDNPAIVESAKDLKDLLENEYRYPAKEVVLESTDERGSDPTSQLIKEVSDLVYLINRKSNADGQKGNNLFILYYGGNGAYKKDHKGIWFNRQIRDYSCVEWEDVESSIKAAKCDILLISDCCHSTGIVTRGVKWQSRCEILTACGTVEMTSAKSNNFTAALTSVLRDSVDNPKTAAHISWQLSDKILCTKFGLKATPQWGCLSKGENLRSTIMLAPRSTGSSSPHNKKDTSNGANDTMARAYPGIDEFNRAIINAEQASDAYVLMAIRFTSPDDRPFLDEWLEWISDRPQNISDVVLETPEAFIKDLVLETLRRSVKCHCAFPSDSALGIISVPIWLWSCLGPDSAWTFIDIIRSEQNLMQPATRLVAPELKATASRAVQTAFIDDARPPTPPSPVLDFMTSALGREEQHSAERSTQFSHRRSVVKQERAAKARLELHSQRGKLPSSLYESMATKEDPWLLKHSKYGGQKIDHRIQKQLNKVKDLGPTGTIDYHSGALWVKFRNDDD